MESMLSLMRIVSLNRVGLLGARWSLTNALVALVGNGNHGTHSKNHSSTYFPCARKYAITIKNVPFLIYFKLTIMYDV